MKLLKSAAFICCLLSSQAWSADEMLGRTAEAEGSAADQVQTLKESLVSLNRDLFLLEEELLFPANTQVSFFVSLDVGKFFALDAVHLTLDDKEVANYLYTAKQIDALKRGGVQRLHVANVRDGEHEITVFFTGRGPRGRDYRRAVSYRFEKLENAQYMELKIVDAQNLLQPDVQIREWQ